jgi:hypothetical protein
VCIEAPCCSSVGGFNARFDIFTEFDRRRYFLPEVKENEADNQIFNLSLKHY